MGWAALSFRASTISGATAKSMSATHRGIRSSNPVNCFIRVHLAEFLVVLSITVSKSYANVISS